jgi:hypothetical protein
VNLFCAGVLPGEEIVVRNGWALALSG